jgi:hypothetical protein
MVENKNFLAQIIEQARLRNLEDARIQAERLRNLGVPSSPVLPQNLNLEGGGASFNELYGGAFGDGSQQSPQEAYDAAVGYSKYGSFLPGGVIMSPMADIQRNEMAQNPNVKVTDTPYGPYGRMMGYSDVPASYTSWTEAQPQMRDEALAAWNADRAQILGLQNTTLGEALGGSYDSGQSYSSGYAAAGSQAEQAAFETAPFESIGVSGIGDTYGGSVGGGPAAGSQSEFDAFDTADFGDIGVGGISSGGDSGGDSGGFSDDGSSGDDYGSDGFSGDSGGDGGGDGGDGGGCFITTATLENTQEADDGETLTTFRAFRDSYMKETAERRDKLKWYYDNAPQIVEDLNTHPEKDEIYQEIYNDYLCEAQDLINKGENEKAEQVYDSMVYFAEDNAKQAVALRDTQEQ